MFRVLSYGAVVAIAMVFVASSGSASVDVYQNLDELNEMNVSFVVEGGDGVVSESDSIPAGYVILGMVSAPLKFFFIGVLAAACSQRIRREVSV